jgi:hypothetical protein
MRGSIAIAAILEVAALLKIATILRILKILALLAIVARRRGCALVRYVRFQIIWCY